MFFLSGPFSEKHFPLQGVGRRAYGHGPRPRPWAGPGPNFATVGNRRGEGDKNPKILRKLFMNGPYVNLENSFNHQGHQKSCLGYGGSSIQRTPVSQIVPRFKGHSSDNMGDRFRFLVHKSARNSGNSCCSGQSSVTNSSAKSSFHCTPFQAFSKVSLPP